MVTETLLCMSRCSAVCIWYHLSQNKFKLSTAGTESQKKKFLTCLLEGQGSGECLGHTCSHPAGVDMGAREEVICPRTSQALSPAFLTSHHPKTQSPTKFIVLD